MDKINKMIKDLEDFINKSDINNSEQTLKMILGELIKYYNQTNIFTTTNRCENITDSNEIDLAYIHIQNIIPKYKYLQLNKQNTNKDNCENIKNELKNELKNINLNLLEFMNNTISVTPKLFSNENFDAALSQYDKNYFELLKNEKIITKITNKNLLSKSINKKNRIFYLLRLAKIH